MKKIAILQSNYIPWKGYFDLIAHVDQFVLYDDMQFTRRDWRNRNIVKTPDGTAWLTIPVQTKGKYTQTIRETETQGDAWRQLHLKTLTANYRRARHFEEIIELVRPIYGRADTNLSLINRGFIEAICGYLGIGTHIADSSSYRSVEGSTERLVDICIQAGANCYVSGPAARDYVVPELFAKAGIELVWFDYSGYPEYDQLWGDFVHGVSVLDLLFNTGRQAGDYMRYVPRRAAVAGQ